MLESARDSVAASEPSFGGVAKSGGGAVDGPVIIGVLIIDHDGGVVRDLRDDAASFVDAALAAVKVRETYLNFADAVRDPSEGLNDASRDAIEHGA